MVSALSPLSPAEAGLGGIHRASSHTLRRFYLLSRVQQDLVPLHVKANGFLDVFAFHVSE